MAQSTKQRTRSSRYRENSIEQLSAEHEIYRSGINFLRKLGYGLLILFFFDLVAILYPPHFLNPAWELTMIGDVVERIVVPLLGLTFVFLGNRIQRTRWEKSIILPVLSILTLLLAIMMFLFIPLGISDAVKLNNAYAKEVQLEVNNQQEQIQAIQEQLNTVKTITEMEQFVGQLSSQQQGLKLPNSQTIEQMKTELSTALVNGQESIPMEAKKTLNSKRLPLLKNSVKWILGSLVAGVLLLRNWQWSRWIWRLS